MLHLENINPPVVQTYLCENVSDEFSKLNIDLRSKRTQYFKNVHLKRKAPFNYVIHTTLAPKKMKPEEILLTS
jgi:hypothetical protein